MWNANYFTDLHQNKYQASLNKESIFIQNFDWNDQTFRELERKRQEFEKLKNLKTNALMNYSQIQFQSTLNIDTFIRNYLAP